jgi:GTP cyclohydrolase II
VDGVTAAPAEVRTRVQVPLRFADGFETTAWVSTFHGLDDGAEHLALELGELPAGRVPLVRLHSECMTGDVFGSARCDCGPQLREAVERIDREGGVLLYLRQEGRGIGLYNKLDAYALQDDGADTYEANHQLGFASDERSYVAAAQMLAALGAERVRLLTNNPDKIAQLRDLGIVVAESETTGVFESPANRSYLRAKVDVTGHSIHLAPDLAPVASQHSMRGPGVCLPGVLPCRACDSPD